MKNKNIELLSIHNLLYYNTHIGNRTFKWNFLIKDFLFGSRHGVYFFNLKKVLPYIKRMLYLFTKSSQNHQLLLFIGSHLYITTLILFLAETTRQASTIRKWVGGTLTNWKLIRSYISFLYTTNPDKIRRKYEYKTTKKIQQKIDRYFKMKVLFTGIERISAIPNIIVILDKNVFSYPMLEAYSLFIPIVTIINTDRSPNKIVYPILGNDTLFESILFYITIILQAIKTGIHNKRLFFVEIYSTFLKKILSLKKIYYRRNFIEILIKKYKTYTQMTRSFKEYLLKKTLRKFCYFAELQNKNKINANNKSNIKITSQIKKKKKR